MNVCMVSLNFRTRTFWNVVVYLICRHWNTKSIYGKLRLRLNNTSSLFPYCKPRLYKRLIPLRHILQAENPIQYTPLSRKPSKFSISEFLLKYYINAQQYFLPDIGADNDMHDI